VLHTREWQRICRLRLAVLACVGMLAVLASRCVDDDSGGALRGAVFVSVAASLSFYTLLSAIRYEHGHCCPL